MLEEKKKSWFKRHKILSGIGGFFLFLIIIGIFQGASEGVSEDNPKNTNTIVESISTAWKNSENAPQINLNSDQVSCPDLSEMKLIGYSSMLQAWTAEKVEVKNIVYDYSIEWGNKEIIFCEEGSEEGQNPNYVYCGDWFRPINLNILNDEGLIEDKLSIQIIFDKNTKEYISTKCNVYDLI